MSFFISRGRRRRRAVARRVFQRRARRRRRAVGRRGGRRGGRRRRRRSTRGRRRFNFHLCWGRRRRRGLLGLLRLHCAADSALGCWERAWLLGSALRRRLVFRCPRRPRAARGLLLDSSSFCKTLASSASAWRASCLGLRDLMRGALPGFLVSYSLTKISGFPP